MRTTVSIDDDLLRRAKLAAASSPVRHRGARSGFAWVTAGASGVWDGVDLSDNAAVCDLMDGIGLIRRAVPGASASPSDHGAAPRVSQRSSGSARTLVVS